MYPKPLTPPRKRRQPHRKLRLFSVAIIVALIGYGAITITRPFAELKPNYTDSSLSITTSPSQLPWPSYGQGAFGLSNGTVIATKGEQDQLPIASVAKVITCLVILERHPLKAGESGPTIKLGARDVALYNDYIAKDGSVMPVFNGHKLTQRQMIQAIMLPSANNVADSLVLWSFGSMDAYLKYANNYLQKQGLTNTKVGVDASGYSPASVSTTTDLIKLGGLAMKQPALAEIAGQKTAVIPDVGTVRNYNSILGSNGIVGLKTGNHDQNGGVFVGAANVQVNGKTITLISALSGANTLSAVLRDSRALLAAASTTFAETTIVKKDAVLGTYTLPDGKHVQAVAAGDLSVTVLRGDTVKARLELEPISYNAKAGKTVGRVTLPATDISDASSLPVVLKQAPVKPDLVYRLLHP